MSSLSPNPALPREFEHPALQELVARGRTHGTVDAEAFRVACESAQVNDAKRLKVVLRGLAATGVTVAEPVTATVKVAAATTTARKGTSATVDPDAPAPAPAKRRAPAKKAAPATDDDTSEAKPATKRAAAPKAAAAKTTAAKGTTAKATAAKAAAAKKASEDEPEAASGDLEDVVVEDTAVVADDAVVAEGAPAGKTGDEPEEGGAFVYSDADDDDAPAQQVVTAGATADPVKDYLKQIGKVALLNAEQEVDLAKRIEAGLFAEERLELGTKLEPKMRRELRVDRR